MIYMYIIYYNSCLKMNHLFSKYSKQKYSSSGNIEFIICKNMTCIFIYEFGVTKRCFDSILSVPFLNCLFELLFELHVT